MAEYKRDADIVLMELLEALTQAVGAAGQLIFHTGQPIGLIAIREALLGMKDLTMMVAPQNRSLVAPQTVYV